MEVPTGLEPMITELQSVALPTWPRNQHLLFINLKLVKYTILHNESQYYFLKLLTFIDIFYNNFS